MSNSKILVVEDEELIRITLKDDLGKNGYDVETAEDGEEGWRVFREFNPALALVDLKLPKMDGISLLKKFKTQSPETMVIMMTAYGTIESAVQAMKVGAYDYITKPFLPEDLLTLLKRALEVYDLREENRILRSRLGTGHRFQGIIGKSLNMQEVFQLIGTIAKTDASVLICGETGTGKELIAEAVHNLSARKDKPLIKINCSVFSETLLESELFGHEKGAFTDAVSKKSGRFEMANTGTLFLDDIDDIRPEVQVKLLRILQAREFERVGGTETVKVDVRIITATKKDLKELVKEGKFREDLFYRLNVIPVYVPPLRERKEDIALLVNHFIEKYGRGIKKLISPQAVKLLALYDWPGNVRELENLIERAMAISNREEILPADISSILRMDRMDRKEEKEKSIQEVIKESEKEHIIKVLIQTKGRKEEASRILGISRKTLWQKLKEYGINE